MTNFSNFLSQIKTHSFSKPYSFNVFISDSQLRDDRGLLKDKKISETFLISLYCKSSFIPAQTVNIMVLPYKGRQMKVPGEKTFPEWTCNIISDEKHIIRSFFEDWINLISNNITAHRQETEFFTRDIMQPNNMRIQTSDIRNQIFRTIDIEQLDTDGRRIETYTLFNAFPSALSTMDLNAESISNTQDLTVTFAYQYYKVGELKPVADSREFFNNPY